MTSFIRGALVSHVYKFWAFLLLGLGITLVFGIVAIWRSAHEPLDNIKNDFVTMQTRMIEQWIDYQITGAIEGLQFLARQPIVVSTTIGETESNRQLLNDISQFDLISNLASVHVIDVLQDEVAKNVIDPMWKAVFHQGEIIAAAKSQFETGKPWLQSRMMYGQNVLLAAVPVKYSDLVEGAIVATLHLKVSRNDFSDIGLENAELYNTLDVAHEHDTSDEHVHSVLSNSGLILKTKWDFSGLKSDRTVLVRTMTISLLSALLIAFAALGIVGHLLIIRPQRLLDESRTELIRSEQRARELAAVAECANDAVIITDSAGKITWVNKSMIQLSGYKIADVIGKSPGALLQGKNTCNDTRREIRQALEDQREIKAEILNYTKDNQPYWVELAISPVFDTRNEVTRFIAIERDITEQKKREAELRTAHQQAEAANIAKSRFLATMSHEIRTPMNGVIGMLDMLQTLSLDNTAAKYVNTARSSADTLLVIINDILDFSKIEAGKLEVEKIPVDLQELVKETCTISYECANQKSVWLYSTIRQNSTYTLSADPVRIKQVLSNLLSNAIKFTSKGTVEIRLSTEAQKNIALVEILDTGVGISDTASSSLFEPFQQEDSTTTRRFGGTGLGLAICKQLVELMGGEIGYRKRHSKGTAFWFTLPLTVSGVDSTRESQPLPTQTGKHFLCILSNEKQRIFSSELSMAGHSVTSTSPHDQTFVTTGDQHFDFILVEKGHLSSESLTDFLTMSQRRGSLIVGIGNNDAHSAPYISTQIIEPVEFPDCITQILQIPTGGQTTDLPLDSKKPPELRRYSGRILVVDDNPINQMVAESMLDNLGLDVDLADDGYSAAEMVSNCQYELVLMDRHMPDRDGLETTRIIRTKEREESRHTRIVALTASSMESDRKQCIDAGMDDFMTKPLTIESMTTILDKWLHNDPSATAKAA